MNKQELKRLIKEVIEESKNTKNSIINETSIDGILVSLQEDANGKFVNISIADDDHSQVFSIDVKKLKDFLNKVDIK